MTAAKRPRKRKPKTDAEPRKKRTYTFAKVVEDPGRECPHCHKLHGHIVLDTYKTGCRRLWCRDGCGGKWLTKPKQEKEHIQWLKEKQLVDPAN